MSFSGLGIALSLVFGCLVLALVAAVLCYMLWWKKRRTHTGIGINHGNDVKGMKLFGFCWKTPSTTNRVSVTNDSENESHEPDLELGTGKDLLLKAFGGEGVESELMRLHNLAGPPRFLFTIKEETKEDLESEDGKSRGDRSRKGSRTRSLSDLMVTIDTPFLNSMASSPLKFDSYKHQGFNPLFESSVESELSRFRSSPPPKFKFLRDAEEKLYRRLIEEAKRKAQMNYGSVPEIELKDSPNSITVIDDIDKSSLRFINNKEKEQIELQQHLPQFPSSSSQVLPLESSPTTLRPVQKASMVH
ncbi:uncharacterized protein LOC133315586 [Gastrolobium bilobum]|uniref:uncharacterized protein LOC133315586 n=1 Tax=Gastrolobium bilobum TaxID=150636 RepID=UPI002AB203BC|nr:uncharacterized protein LOC133315586 [Gastrolobium bilobum]